MISVEHVRSQRWQEMVAYLRDARDGNDTPIDEGIFDTCVALNLLGFTTTQSCEGHLDWGIPAPWVQIVNEEARTLNERAYSAFARGTSEKPPAGIMPHYTKEAYEEGHAWRKQADSLIAQDFHKLLGYVEQFYRQRQIEMGCRVTLRADTPSIRLEILGAAAMPALSIDQQHIMLAQFQDEMKAFTAHLISYC